MIDSGLLMRTPFGLEEGRRPPGAARAAGPRVVGAPEAAEHWLDGDDLPLGRRVDLLAVPDVDADMRNPVAGVGVRAGKEHQVAGLELVLRNPRRGVVLQLRGP